MKPQLARSSAAEEFLKTNYPYLLEEAARADAFEEVEQILLPVWVPPPPQGGQTIEICASTDHTRSQALSMALDWDGILLTLLTHKVHKRERAEAILLFAGRMADFSRRMDRLNYRDRSGRLELNQDGRSLLPRATLERYFQTASSTSSDPVVRSFYHLRQAAEAGDILRLRKTGFSFSDVVPEALVQSDDALSDLVKEFYGPPIHKSLITLDQRADIETTNEVVDDLSDSAIDEGLSKTDRAIADLASALNVSREAITSILSVAELLPSPAPKPKKPLPTKARIAYEQRHKDKALANLDIVDFLRAEYAPWLDGTLTRQVLRRLDPSAYRAMANRIALKTWPADLWLPTRGELTGEAAEILVRATPALVRNVERIAQMARRKGLMGPDK